MNNTLLRTPLGIALIEGTPEGISKITISEEPKELIKAPTPPYLQQAVKQLQEYFAGDRKEFQLKLNPSGTAFQKKVWHLLEQIPYGTTASYLELSKQFGNPAAIRAVAAANGKNPLWIVIPCHRVIGSDGSLTGYAGGLWRKKWLLEHEQVSKQQSLFPYL